MSRVWLNGLFAATMFMPAFAMGDWTSFLGPERNGRSNDQGRILNWGDEGPQKLWRLDVGDGYAGPVIADGRLFQFDRYGDTARLLCLAASTGKRLWEAEYPTAYRDLYGFSNGPRASPLIDGDRVYTFGAEGRLRCHRAEDGALIWEVDTVKAYGVVQNFFGVGSTPVIHGDLLITMVGGSPEDSPRIQSGKVSANGSGIVAFHKKTGKEVYRLGQTLASYASPQIARSGGRAWGLAFVREGLLVFEPSQGKQDFLFPWRARRLESVNAATPVVVNDKVFLTESYEKGGVFLQFSGEQAPRTIWQDPPRRNQSLASHWSTPVHHQGFLYGCHGESAGNAELRCINLETGEVAWRQPGLRRTSLIYAQDHFWVLGEDGTLYQVAADPTAYREVQRAKVTTQPAWNTPSLADGILFVRGEKEIVALRVMETGTAP